MKSLIAVLVLALTTGAAAGDANTTAFLAGAAAATTLFLYKPAQKHVVSPVVKAVQRTVRPLPQDKVDRANRKAEKLQRKSMKKATTNKTVQLNWQPSAGSNVTYYRIYKSNPQMRNWHATAIIPAASCCTFTASEPTPIAPVTAGYFVTALDSSTGIESGPSNAAIITINP